MTHGVIFPLWQPSAPAHTLLCFAHFKPPLILLKLPFCTLLIHSSRRPRKKKRQSWKETD
ncbi:unnamed protein product [Gulo gulo]|uniref:Uncharacterized protein n=1 Tax=Gulo gulo TaxID=48420 RepID=A0A9X9Q6N2_GULGU|nr:unnamed protein product [Gulo gulo]